MKHYFTKTFLRFLLGFVGIIFTAFFALGYFATHTIFIFGLVEISTQSR